VAAKLEEEERLARAEQEEKDRCPSPPAAPQRAPAPAHRTRAHCVARARLPSAAGMRAAVTERGPVCSPRCAARLAAMAMANPAEVAAAARLEAAQEQRLAKAAEEAQARAAREEEQRQADAADAAAAAAEAAAVREPRS